MDIKKHWESLGHEVRYEPGASEFLAQWADIYYVDTWDNNLGYLYRLYHGLHDDMPADWDNSKKPLIVCRALDWEVWLGHAKDQNLIDWVDKVICIAPHIEKELRAHGNFGDKLRVIKPGVNLEKFTLKTKETDGFQLGMCLGDMWFPKQHMMGLDIFHRLWKEDQRWRLHIRGQHEKGTEYWKVMFDYYLESRGIQDVVKLYPPLDDMNDFYEEIDILLHPGQKEGFCYAVAEAMAKGIPAVVNDFYGSHDIWPGWLYEDSDNAITKIKMYNKNRGYLDPRQYIKDKYPLEKMLKEIDEYIGS